MGKTLIGRAWQWRITTVAAAAATVVTLSLTLAVSDASAHGTCAVKARVLHANTGGVLGSNQLGGYGEAVCVDRHDAMEICVKLQRQLVPGLDPWTTVDEDCHFATNPPDGIGGLNVRVWVPCGAGNWRAVAYGYARSSTGENHSLDAVSADELRIC